MEPEAVLVGLPVSTRGCLPKTSRVPPQLMLAATGAIYPDAARGRPDQSRSTGATLDALTTLTRRIKDLDARIHPILTALGCTCHHSHGIGSVTAMDLLCEVGDSTALFQPGPVHPVVRGRHRSISEPTVR